MMEHRDFLEILGAVAGMSAGQAEKLVQAIEGRGDLDEVHALIERNFERDKKCPHCGKTHLQRWSKSSGLQRWKCMSCGKTFNALTGTPLARMRKREQWLNFARTLIQSLSVREAAKRCSVSKNTSFAWRHRFLEALNKPQEQILAGVGEVDEAFFCKISRARDIYQERQKNEAPKLKNPACQKSKSRF